MQIWNLVNSEIPNSAKQNLEFPNSNKKIFSFLSVVNSKIPNSLQTKKKLFFY